MQKTTRRVRDLASDERRLYEAVLGENLRDSQIVVIEVVNAVEPFKTDEDVSRPPGALPPWCNVYEGLSDEDVAEVERVALRRSDMSRPS